MNTQLILMFSGGLDSTYVLWELLSRTDLPVHCHHVELRVASEPRWEHEKGATANVYKYCTANCRKFSHGYSAYSWPVKTPYVGWDSDLILVEAQKVAGNFALVKGIEKVQVILGWCQDDLERDVVKERASRNVTPNLWKALHAGLYAHQRKIVADTLSFPLLEQKKYKKDLLPVMPPELAELAWTCRKPTKEGTPCHQCHACRSLSAAKAGRILKSVSKKRPSPDLPAEPS